VAGVTLSRTVDDALAHLATRRASASTAEGRGGAHSLPGYFTPDFWCYPMFKKGNPPGTLGLLIQDTHPALAAFPTRFYSEWQWRQPARYTCYRAAGPIVVDGKLDEPSWRMAPKSTPFVDIVTGEPAWFDTRVALLWDDDHLYFGFWIEETDVWGTLTERDSKIWEENDVEVFIGGTNAYYEFEINALNTVYEVFWIWKDILKPGSPYYGRPEFDPPRSGPWCSMA
jgi:hypothetical protein